MLTTGNFISRHFVNKGKKKGWDLWNRSQPPLTSLTTAAMIAEQCSLCAY
jgi:hypothetical protein